MRICLCAQSHAAVDELIRRLDRQNIQVKRKGKFKKLTTLVCRVERSGSVGRVFDLELQGC